MLNEKVKREIGDVWKEDGLWKVQFPYGIDGWKTKKSAMRWSALVKKTLEDNLTKESMRWKS